MHKKGAIPPFRVLKAYPQNNSMPPAILSLAIDSANAGLLKMPLRAAIKSF